MNRPFNKIGLFTILAAIVLAFQACGNGMDGQSNHGGGIEIPNGIKATVALRLTDSAGMALGNTRILLIAGESWTSKTEANESVVVDSVETDSQGLALVPVTESKMFILAHHKGQGIHQALQPKDSAGTTFANPLSVAMRGLARLKVKSEASQTLAVFGTPWRLIEESNAGEYIQDSVPQGEYMLVDIDESLFQMGQTTETIKFDTLTDAVAVTFSDPYNLMLTNFENRRLRGIWDPLHIGGYWWATATVNGEASWEHLGMQVLEDLLDSADGNVFAGIKVQFKNQLQTAEETVANFGLDFSTEPVNTNLGKASNVSFKAHGNGEWKIYVQTQDSLGVEVLRWVHSLSLSSEWQQFQIPFDDFTCETDSSKLWKNGVRLGTNLFWQTESDGEIQVDDIVLEGLEFSDWIDP